MVKQCNRVDNKLQYTLPELSGKMQLNNSMEISSTRISFIRIHPRCGNVEPLGKSYKSMGCAARAILGDSILK